ncbi:MAG TPA: polyribonucleotide nucleotidyltransferase, partial [Galbitalea sp.]|nr:polyribonucleotide nucleotidyltransferase [Galbitalea sp.]
VDVEERSYAAGKIPGSFFRREGRPSTEAILVCRLIDRPLRPTFVEGLRNEVQIVITVLSIAPDEFYDALAINAASLSTQISGLPFYGPVAGIRLALMSGHGAGNDQWIAFPKYSQLEEAVFDLTVAGRLVTDKNGVEDVAIMMVEAEATEGSWDLIKAGATKPDETVVAEGLEAAKPFLKQLIKAQLEIADQAAKAIQEFPLFPPYTQGTYDAVAGLAYDDLKTVYQIADKIERQNADDELKDRVKGHIASEVEAERLPAAALGEVSAAYKSVSKKVMRARVLTEGIRIDGRGLTDIRALDAEVQVIPRVHGSAIFQRGETQILGVTTLNMLKMEQQIDSLAPVKKKRYLHHYNFPPYSTGETGRVGSPKRREIGHGFLAERALVPVLPPREEFPYAIRQVSEALGSNGSTSMGSVCASTLSLLNAGVPLRAPVAGIAMGLISDEVDGETRYAALTDILGAEDALGDMDFKVAGTSEFVTAIQLDTKLAGLPSSVLNGALKQAKEARTTILAVINAAIDAPDEMAPTAPRVISVQIPIDKIGELIGPKGKTINQIQDDTGADISIEDDGTVYIGAVDGPSAEAARAAVNAIANPLNPEVGERFLGTVVKIATFGAFVSLTPGKDGLLHISEVRKLAGGKRVENVEDVLGVGQKIQVEITKIDDRGKLSLAPVLEGDDAPAGDLVGAGIAEGDSEE